MSVIKDVQDVFSVKFTKIIQIFLPVRPGHKFRIQLDPDSDLKQLFKHKILQYFLGGGGGWWNLVQVVRNTRWNCAFIRGRTPFTLSRLLSDESLRVPVTNYLAPWRQAIRAWYTEKPLAAQESLYKMIHTLQRQKISSGVSAPILKPSRSRIHKRTISLRFLGIFLRVLRLDVFYKPVSNQGLLKGGGGGGV